MASIGYTLNEVSNWEEWRKYELGSAIAEIASELDADNFEVGDVWVESATHANLPGGMTQGIITTRVSEPVNGKAHKSQMAIGRDNSGVTVSAVRYFNGTTWLDWV